MTGTSQVDPQQHGHGDVFAPDLGAMIVHVQRETGLAHQTFVFRSWQIQLFRAAASRAGWIAAAAIIGSWAYLAIQAARVPFLTTRIARMEIDALRLDTLQSTLKELQARYEQVQAMLSRPTTGAPRASAPTRP